MKDLTEAISSNALATETEPGYVSVWGAKAILSRVYLNMGDYANALSVAEDIIKNSGAALWTRDQYLKAWDASTPNESEFLFRLNVAGSTDNNDLNGIGNLQQRDGYKEMVATKKFVDMLTSDPKMFVTICSCQQKQKKKLLFMEPIKSSLTNFVVKVVIFVMLLSFQLSVFLRFT